MAAHRRLLLAVTVLSPELPRATHLDRAIAVCFCGRPVPAFRWVRVRKDRPAELTFVERCEACGWAPPWRRAAERVIADADLLAEQLDESLEGPLSR